MVKSILIKSPDEWATTKQACRDESVAYLFLSSTNIYIYIYIYIYTRRNTVGTVPVRKQQAQMICQINGPFGISSSLTLGITRSLFQTKG